MAGITLKRDGSVFLVMNNAKKNYTVVERKESLLIIF